MKTKTKKVCKAAESVAEVIQNTQLQVAYHFPCPIYIIERPDFLEAVNTTSEEALEVQRKERDLNEIYPVYMTGSYYADPRLKEFTELRNAG
jgi:non-homologous end joining protein Ku